MHKRNVSFWKPWICAKKATVSVIKVVHTYLKVKVTENASDIFSNIYKYQEALRSVRRQNTLVSDENHNHILDEKLQKDYI